MKCLQRAFYLKSFVVHPEQLENKNIGTPNFRRSAASSSSLKSFIIIVFPPIISWYANFQLFHFSRSFIDMMQTIEVILIWLRLNRPWSKKYLSPVLERTIHIPVSQCNKGPKETSSIGTLSMESSSVSDRVLNLFLEPININSGFEGFKVSLLDTSHLPSLSRSWDRLDRIKRKSDPAQIMWVSF